MYFACELRPSGSPQPIKIPLQISHAKFIVKKSRESLKSSFNEPEKNKIPNGTIIDWAFKTKVFPTYHKSNEVESCETLNTLSSDVRNSSQTSCRSFTPTSAF